MIEQHPEKPTNKSKNKTIFILVTLFILAIAIASIFLLNRGPVCGNNICEPFETPDNCCKDCDCWGKGEVCNIQMNKCEVREINISDQRINELVLEYFQNKSKEVESVKIGDLITMDNKLGKNVMVYIKGQEWFIGLVVMEDEKIIESKV